jgi:hypothetical protein
MLLKVFDQAGYGLRVNIVHGPVTFEPDEIQAHRPGPVGKPEANGSGGSRIAAAADLHVFNLKAAGVLAIADRITIEGADIPCRGARRIQAKEGQKARRKYRLGLSTEIIRSGSLIGGV